MNNPKRPVRRQRASAAEDDSDRLSPLPPKGPPPAGNRPVGWALATGLAVGFIIGREAHRFGGKETITAGPVAVGSADPLKGAAPAGLKLYTKEDEFPAGWVKSADLPTAVTALEGLNEAQKTTVMQALNERECECGCQYGKLSTCLQKDPHCPRSPAMAKLAADMVKQGKGLADILAAIDDKQKAEKKPAGAGAAAPEAPSKPQYIEVAAWNPRKGTYPAKVTILEFSDFQ